MKISFVSSLEKVFLDCEPRLIQSSGNMLKNERYHIGVWIQNDTPETLYHCNISIKSDLKNYITLYEVDNIPAVVVNRSKGIDDYVLSDKSGLYPDLLREINGIEQVFPPNKNRGYFLEIAPDSKEIPKGSYPITLCVEDQAGTVLCSDIFRLDVIDRSLPENDLLVTQWIHFDCIAAAHRCKMFSERFYSVCGDYIRTAVKYGQTMLLVPLFTFALDTEDGGERATFQTVKIKKAGDAYRFDFSELKKFMAFALSCGVKTFELSHLFTQWGALHAPKIVAEVNGKTKKIFGWDTDSCGEEYGAFLDAFLPALDQFLSENGWKEKCLLHLSDEPNGEAVKRYGALKARIRKSTDIPVIDALSHYEFYRDGLVDLPAVASDCTDLFIQNKADFLVYYCNAQCDKYLSNRFFCMPSQRNRILGIQLYLSGAKGFLHWGFNFYNSGFSLFKIDPYRVSDAGGFFPAGDSFIVYPTGGGCTPSLRLLVFYDGIQDYLALKLLEKERGRQFVVDLLKEENIEGFTKYPRSAEWHIAFRNKINAIL